MTSEFKLEVGEYETVNGCAVRIAFVDGDNAFGRALVNERWQCGAWELNGFSVVNSKYDIKPPKPKPLVRWVNVYPDGVAYLHATKESADQGVDVSGRRVSRIRIELPIGQFDEEIS